MNQQPIRDRLFSALFYTVRHRQKCVRGTWRRHQCERLHKTALLTLSYTTLLYRSLPVSCTLLMGQKDYLQLDLLASSRRLKHGRVYIQSGPKKWAVVLLVVTSSVMDQFKETPLLESLLNFQKGACSICHVPSKMLSLYLAKWQTVTKWLYIGVAYFEN